MKEKEDISPPRGTGQWKTTEAAGLLSWSIHYCHGWWHYLSCSPLGRLLRWGNRCSLALSSALDEVETILAVAGTSQNNSCRARSPLLHFGLHLKKPKPVCHCSSCPKPSGLAICDSCKFSVGRAQIQTGEKDKSLGVSLGYFFTPQSTETTCEY